MDTREFDVNDYHIKAKLHTGPGPYLYRVADGRESQAAAGEYLLYEGETIVGHLPARIIDALSLQAEELITVERARMINDHQETVEQLKVEVGPGEKFDGMKVVDKDGNVVEGKSLHEVLPMRLASTDDLKTDESGNAAPKDDEDRKVDLISKQQAIMHPVNRFNEASQRAAREVADLAAKNQHKEFEEVEIGSSEKSKEKKFREVMPEEKEGAFGDLGEVEKNRQERERRREAERMNTGMTGSSTVGQRVPASPNPNPEPDTDFA